MCHHNPDARQWKLLQGGIGWGQEGHIKQLAAIGECDVEFDLIAHRRAPLNIIHALGYAVLPINYFPVPKQLSR